MVSNIPRDKKKEDFQKHLEGLFPGSEVKKVVYTYEIYKLVKLMDKREALESKKERKEKEISSQLQGLNLSEGEAEIKFKELDQPTYRKLF